MPVRSKMTVSKYTKPFQSKIVELQPSSKLTIPPPIHLVAPKPVSENKDFLNKNVVTVQHVG